MEVLSHELVITEEAKFDYADLFGMLVGDFGNDLPPYFNINPNIKEEVETYIKTRKSLWHKHYLRLTYLVEESDIDLMLFIKQGKVLENIQHWELVGICDKEAWNEDLEESGQIRAWYETKIVNIPEERDWLLVENTYKIIDKLEEIRDIGEYEDYIEARERVAEELSKPQIDGGGYSEVKPGRIKRFLEKGYYNSNTAIEIIRQLNIIIDRCRENLRRDSI